MTNRRFLLLTEQERNAKFKAALHAKSEGSLTGDEIQKILRVLPPDKQYEILVYHKEDEFCLGVARLKGAKKRLILGEDSRTFRNQLGKLEYEATSQAVAIAVWKKTSLEECSQLHILIPPGRCRKEQESL